MPMTFAACSRKAIHDFTLVAVAVEFVRDVRDRDVVAVDTLDDDNGGNTKHPGHEFTVRVE